jgi:hypothetical protein
LDWQSFGVCEEKQNMVDDCALPVYLSMRDHFKCPF